MRCSAFGVADDRLDCRPVAHVAFDGLRGLARLAREIDLEVVLGRGVVASILPAIQRNKTSLLDQII
jgi:hypothetical protein